MTTPPSQEPSVEVWSCNPADIKPWTTADKARFGAVLSELFGWPSVEDVRPPVDSGDAASDNAGADGTA